MQGDRYNGIYTQYTTVHIGREQQTKRQKEKDRIGEDGNGLKWRDR